MGVFPLQAKKQKNTLKQHAKATRSSWGYSKSQRLIQPVAGHFRSDQHDCRPMPLDKIAPKSSGRSSKQASPESLFIVGNFGIITCLL